MPAIELRDSGLDSAWLLALMNFPTDESMRRSYYALQWARAELENVGKNGSVEIAPEFLNDLIDSPSYEEMRARVKETTKRGLVAGDFLASVFAMYSFPNDFKEPSVSKALDIAKAYAKRSRYGDGSKLPGSQTAIRKCVAEFRSVAHLWAAFRLHQAFPIRPHRELFASSEAIRDFLGIAGTLQDFGCWFVPKRAKPKSPLLETRTIWSVPANAPRLIPPWSSPPDWLLQTTRGYKPRRR